MLTKITFKTAIFIGLIFMVQQNCFAQKTKNELKAERDVLKTEMKSKDSEERKIKFNELTEPKTSGVSSIDGLAESSTKLLLSTKQISELVPEMYKRTVGESVDGVADVTVKKPTVEELSDLGSNIARQIKAVTDMSSIVTSASADLKTATMMQAPKCAKSLNFSKDVMRLILPELNLNLKMIGNLISTLKTSDNY